MIFVYREADAALVKQELKPGAAISDDTLWIDVLQPNQAELNQIKRTTGLDVPDRDEMTSFETSDRFSTGQSGLVMSALLPSAISQPDPETATVTFMLSRKVLVTIRHGEPRSLAMAAEALQNDPTIPPHPSDIFLLILEIVVDRAADVMEAASLQVDQMSHLVFVQGIAARKRSNYQQVIRTQGKIGIQVTKLHEVCANLSRLLIHVQSHTNVITLTQDHMNSLQALASDARSIKEHGDALDNKLGFLLDATIGLVNLEQNQITKIFSIVSVIFLPPTLLASIYGMNFEHMPQLAWTHGFAFALGLMLACVSLSLITLRLTKLL